MIMKQKGIKIKQWHINKKRLTNIYRQPRNIRQLFTYNLPPDPHLHTRANYIVE